MVIQLYIENLSNFVFTVIEELKEQGNVFMLLEDDNEVECSAELDYEFYYQSI